MVKIIMAAWKLQDLSDLPESFRNFKANPSDDSIYVINSDTELFFGWFDWGNMSDFGHKKFNLGSSTIYVC